MLDGTLRQCLNAIAMPKTAACDDKKSTCSDRLLPSRCFFRRDPRLPSPRRRRRGGSAESRAPFGVWRVKDGRGRPRTKRKTGIVEEKMCVCVCVCERERERERLDTTRTLVERRPALLKTVGLKTLNLKWRHYRRHRR